MQLIASRASAQYINKEEANALVKKLGQSKSDTNRVIILVTLGKFHTYKQGKTQKDLDSSFTYLNWARQLSDTLNIKYYQHQTESMIVTLMLNQGNLAGAEIRYQALMADCDKTGDIQCKVDAMFRHAIFLSSANSNSPVAIKEFTEAAKIYHKLSEPKEEARMYYELAFINFNKGNLNLAETGLLDVVSRYKAIKSPKLSKPYNLLSTLYRIKGDFNNGLKYAMLTIDEAKKSGDTVREAYFFGDLARLYMEAGDRQEELAWYNKAVDKWERQGSAEYGMYLAQGYLITDMIDHHQSLEAFNAVRRLGKKIPPVSDIQRACFYRNLALCYDALRKYGLAEKYYLDAVNLYTKAKMDFEGSQEVYPQIGRFYLEQKQYAKAGSFLRSSLLFNPQQLSLYAIRDVHFMLFKVDSAEKNYLTAIDHQRIAKSLNDSIFNRTKVREMAKLQVQFKTSELRQQYKNEQKIHGIQLHQSRQRQNVIIGFACVLCIILLLLLNQYRIKQTSNKQLKAQQVEISNQNFILQHMVDEKEWLVKEMHHRVKNNLQTIVSLLESQVVYLSNTDALAAVKDSQHRIHAMSLIHQKLYLTDDMTTLNMSNYIDELVSYLSQSVSGGQNIIFKREVAPLAIDVAAAIPLGLILNEAITNSIKYAFTDKEGDCIISIKFYLEDTIYKLSIADNGSGLPFKIQDKVKTDTLGLTLMRGLCKEIGATFDIKNDDGVIIRITFKPLTFKKGSFSANK